VRYAPVSARYKVYIIDEVHMLSTAAFNALLKTLEEPPPHVKFIFATTEIRKVPVTVLSRCQRFDLRRIKTVGPRSLSRLADAVEGYSRGSDLEPPGQRRRNGADPPGARRQPADARRSAEFPRRGDAGRVYPGAIQRLACYWGFRRIRFAALRRFS
jgi:hypothetical protein